MGECMNAAETYFRLALKAQSQCRPARESEIGQSKLLEQTHGERLDTGTAGTASGLNPDMEAVGAVRRAENASR